MIRSCVNVAMMTNAYLPALSVVLVFFFLVPFEHHRVRSMINVFNRSIINNVALFVTLIEQSFIVRFYSAVNLLPCVSTVASLEFETVSY